MPLMPGAPCLASFARHGRAPRIQSFNCHRHAFPLLAKEARSGAPHHLLLTVNKGDVMRKIRIIEHISLDGVIQAPGGPKEDTSSGFKYGGWSAPHDDPEGGAAIVAAHGEAFDLLLGRRT